MKSLILTLFLFQMILQQQDTLLFQQSVNDKIQSTALVETVKVIVQEKSIPSRRDNFIQNILNEMITDTLSLGWRIIISIALIMFMGYLNYRLNRFYNQYNLSKRIRNADFLKVLFHILIWLLTILLIVFVFLKSSLLFIVLFLLFIFIVLIISIGDLAKNVVGGILILLDKPFEYGDWIKIGEYSGRVHSKNLRNTEIITEDDSLIKIPNRLFVNEAFENLNVISKNKQVSFVVEVPPQPEISKIKSSLNEITSLSIFNSMNKPVEVIYKGINDRGKMEFQIKAYVFDAKYENEFKSDVQENIADIFGLR